MHANQALSPLLRYVRTPPEISLTPFASTNQPVRHFYAKHQSTGHDNAMLYSVSVCRMLKAGWMEVEKAAGAMQNFVIMVSIRTTVSWP